MLEGAKRRSREWQRDQLRRTGFATPQPELGHAIEWALRDAGYPLTVAQIGAQLGAVGTAYNFQGNTRIAAIVGRHKRTVQRARARLEADGLIRSELLLRGDLLDGMRAPVQHLQVVREVSALQRLARVREQARTEKPRRRKGSRRPSAAAAPAPAPAPAPDSATVDHRALAIQFTEAYFTAQAGAKRQPPPPVAATIDPREIDAAERDIAELERIVTERQRVRGPPRAPPR